MLFFCGETADLTSVQNALSFIKDNFINGRNKFNV